MFSRTVRHVGDRVAAVVAEDEATARRALGLIEVSYDVLPPVLSLDEAMAGSLTPVHGGPSRRHRLPAVHRGRRGQEPRGQRFRRHRGMSMRVSGWRRSWLSAPIRRAGSSARHSNPTSSYTKMDGDRLVVHASTQVPWHLRRIVARVLGNPENRIRVIKERMGGGYGSKQDILLEEVCAWATLRTGRPVLYKYTQGRGVHCRHDSSPLPRHGEDGREEGRHDLRDQDVRGRGHGGVRQALRSPCR